MPSDHLILSHPLLLLPSVFPSIRVSSNESLLHIRGQSIGASVSASVLLIYISPSNIQGWFPFGLTGLISLQSKGLSRVFSNTTVWKQCWEIFKQLRGDKQLSLAHMLPVYFWVLAQCGISLGAALLQDVNIPQTAGHACLLFQPLEAAREIKLLRRCIHDSVSERPTWAVAPDPGWPVGLAPMTRDLPDWISWRRSHKTGQREIRHFCFLPKDLTHVLAPLCLSFLAVWTSPLLDC